MTSKFIIDSMLPKYHQQFQQHHSQLGLLNPVITSSSSTDSSSLGSVVNYSSTSSSSSPPPSAALVSSRMYPYVSAAAAHHHHQQQAAAAAAFGATSMVPGSFTSSSTAALAAAVDAAAADKSCRYTAALTGNVPTPDSMVNYALGNMRAARTSLLLVAFALLASALHLTLALPAEIAASEAAAAPAAEEAASETVSQRDPEEHHPAPAAPAFHLPRPSEIIHAVGSYVHGAHQQHAQEHHEEVHEQVAEHHEQHHEQHEHHHPTTHRPHHRPPHRPLHPEKEKIKVTKTVLVEFTKLVTRHPVCMKVYGVKPPCLPFQAYSASGAHQPGKPCHHGGIRENDAPAGAFDDEEEGVYADAELKEGLYISPSAVAEMPAATNIVEAPEDLEAAARSARYLELRAPAVPAAPAAPAPVAAPASATPALPVEQSGRQHLIAAAASAASSAADNAAAGVGGLLGHRKPEKIVEYKTLWVTKVEKVWDHRVTATLVAENCVPTDLKIPFCGAGYGPTFEGGDEIVYKPVKPAHKPIHKPVHKPVHHEPVHKPVHHEPVHKPVHHEPVHKPVHHEPVHKPAYKPEVEKPGYVEYSETEVPVDHHWKEGEDEVPAQEEAVAQASVENEAEEKPAFD